MSNREKVTEVTVLDNHGVGGMNLAVNDIVEINNKVLRIKEIPSPTTLTVIPAGLWDSIKYRLEKLWEYFSYKISNLWNRIRK